MSGFYEQNCAHGRRMCKRFRDKSQADTKWIKLNRGRCSSVDLENDTNSYRCSFSHWIDTESVFGQLWRSKTTLQHNIALWKLNQESANKPLPGNFDPPWVNIYNKEKAQKARKCAAKMQTNQEMVFSKPDYSIPKYPPYGCKPKLLELSSRNEIQIIDPDKTLTIPSELKSTKQVSFASPNTLLAIRGKDKGLTESGTTSTWTMTCISGDRENSYLTSKQTANSARETSSMSAPSEKSHTPKLVKFVTQNN